MNNSEMRKHIVDGFDRIAPDVFEEIKSSIEGQQAEGADEVRTMPQVKSAGEGKDKVRGGARFTVRKAVAAACALIIAAGGAGVYLNTASDLVEQMINEGHIVGNHTCSHPSLPSISDEKIEKELMQLHQAVYEKFNYEMKFMRPPKGEFNERTLKKTQELGYKTVMWSFCLHILIGMRRNSHQ